MGVCLQKFVHLTISYTTEEMTLLSPSLPAINSQNFYIYKFNHASETALTIGFDIIFLKYSQTIIPSEPILGHICSGHVPNVNPEHIC